MLQWMGSYTDTEMLSFWWNFHYWLHWKLSFWQLLMPPMMKILSKWWHFCFSINGSHNGLAPIQCEGIIWTIFAYHELSSRNSSALKLEWKCKDFRARNYILNVACTMLAISMLLPSMLICHPTQSTPHHNFFICNVLLKYKFDADIKQIM